MIVPLQDIRERAVTVFRRKKLSTAKNNVRRLIAARTITDCTHKKLKKNQQPKA